MNAITHLEAWKKKDKFILDDPTRMTNEHQVNLQWYKPHKDSEYEWNLGDYLSLVVYRYMLKRYNIPENAYVNSKYSHLYCIGSILHIGHCDATIWGTGCITGALPFKTYFRKFDIRSVRGPLSRELLLKKGKKCPSIYGDPALLLPRIYEPDHKEIKYDFGIIFQLGGGQTEIARWKYYINRFEYQ